SALLATASSAWSLLRLPLFLIASHCSTRRRFVGLVSRHAPMRSLSTHCINTVAQPSPDLRRPLEAPLGFPADHSASRTLRNKEHTAITQLEHTVELRDR